jgi:hypothetical protein
MATHKRNLIKDHNGDLFNVSEVQAVKHVTGGVMIFGANNRPLHFIKVADVDMATLIRDEIILSVEAAAEGRKYVPNWASNTPTAL